MENNNMEIQYHDGAVRNSLKELGAIKTVLLGAQHAITMFADNILVPLLTGLNVSVALVMAGLCTWLFHFITKWKVPIILGSSFAFIAPMMAVITITGDPAYARGGIVIAGLVYMVFSLLIYKFGLKRVMSFFPTVVTGPIVIAIGLSLAGVAVDMASTNWLIAASSFSTIILISAFAKGYTKNVPILLALIVGFIVSVVTGNVDFSPVSEANWIGMPTFTMAKFNLQSIIIVVPVAIATIVEHIGSVSAVSSTVGDNFIKDPGLHRTLLGDGVGTSLSALVGGPANTAYSSNTGILALSKVYDPVVIRIAALVLILLGIVPKLSALVHVVPTAVLGGIATAAFGMISSQGVRALIEEQVDFSDIKNQLVCGSILILSLGGTLVPGGMATAAVVGIIINKLFPEKKKEAVQENEETSKENKVGTSDIVYNT